ncbi:MAG: hypothetical protein RLZZ179_475 [Verrucomicrobiota bacterium]
MLPLASARFCLTVPPDRPMHSFLTANWRTILEALLMGGVLLLLWRFLREAPASRVLAQITVLVLTLLIAAHLLQMELIRSIALFAGLVLVVVFQPEVRRAFVMLGSTRFFSTSRENLALVEAVTEAASQLAAKRCGALLAFERGMDLDQFVETGVEMDSKFTPELVLTIFHPKTALHDGGMVLRQGRIAAAGCVFPVSQRELNDRSIGLRHRAGIGITEQTDAIAVVVSEETGTISLCVQGEIEQALPLAVFRERLAHHLSDRSTLDTEDRDPSSERAPTRRIEA